MEYTIPMPHISRLRRCAWALAFVALLVAWVMAEEPPVRVRKIVDPHSGACQLWTSVPGVHTYAHLDSLIASRRARDRAQHGAIDGPLRERLGTLIHGERVPVRIWLKRPRVEYLNRFTHTEEELREHSMRLRRADSPATGVSFAGRYHLEGARVLASGQIEVSVDRGLLHRLAFDPEVVSIEQVRDPRPMATVVPWSALAAAAQNPSAHPLDKAGEGVVCATVETDDISNYRLCRAGLGTWSLAVVHAEMTYGCLLNAAPKATHRYILGRSYGSPTSDQMVDSGVETVSMSLIGDYSEGSPEARMMDDFAYRWPCPLFCTGAGNFGWRSETAWQSYNAISSGSAKHWQEREYTFDGFTQTRNPDPVYGTCIGGGAVPCAGDRELPEILAPGSHPWEPPDSASDGTVVWSDPCVRGYFADYSGTSFSAPTLNGVAACVISSAPGVMLRHRPEAVKMVLMLTARNVEAGEWDVSDDGRDGAGVVSAYGAIEYVTRCTDLSGRSSPSPAIHGFCSGTGDSTMSQRVFSVAVPDTPAPATHLRVALTWTSNPDLNAGINALSDLDIGAFTSNSGGYGSYSLDDNVEIFDVPGSELTPGATYTFKLLPRAIRIPPGASTRFFYYTLGWTWVPDHAPVVGVQHRPLPDIARNRAPDVQVRSLGNRDLRVWWPRPSGGATMIICDLRGAQIASVALPAATTRGGRAHVHLERPLAAGLYLVKLSAGERQATATLSVSAKAHGF